MNDSAKIAETREPLSFAAVLRNQASCGIILVDSGKKLGVLTGQARQLLGLAPDQTILPAFEALPAPLQAIFRETSASGQAPADRQIELEAGSRGRITLQLSAAPLEPNRKNSGAIVMLSDLTAARQLEERLDQLDRLANMGTLAATMAHEIKNALVAGKTFIDLLLEKNKDAELVEVVRREISRIDAIVSRMLKFTGPARGKFGEVRLHEVLEHSLRLVEPQLTSKSAVLNRSFQAAPDLLQGDDYQLQQAFVNLFLNAVEALGPNGTLSVTTETCAPGARSVKRGAPANRPHLRVAIEDTGTGIAPENMARLFEPFFTTKPQGTGLGLAITRRIILEHRGTISVKSQPGQGTAFEIILPTSA
jgi:two-component system sensor histidine kinase HydH